MTEEEKSNLPADAPWWARWLVAEWGQAWRWLSVQWPLICGTLAEVYAQYGDEIAKHVPPNWVPHIVAAAFWLTMALRLMKQKSPEAK